jgi:DNA-binding NarL/FixJ family response regulator
VGKSSTSLPQRVRVMVADGDAMGSQLMASALRRCHNWFQVVATTNSSSDTLRQASAEKPHVVVLGTELQDGPQSGFEVLRKLSDLQPTPSAGILLQASRRDTVVDAFRFGARGVICRADSFKNLSKCIRSVHSGQIWASNEELEFILQVLTQLKPVQLNDGVGMGLLTRREQMVTRLVVEGMKNRQIAVTLQLTEHTVSNYLYRIFEKLGISTRAELILYALSHLPRGTEEPASTSVQDCA